MHPRIFIGWNIYDDKIEGFFPKDKINIRYTILDDEYNKQLLNTPTEELQLVSITTVNSEIDSVEIDLYNFDLVKLETQHLVEIVPPDIVVKKCYFLKNDESISVYLKYAYHTDEHTSIIMDYSDIELVDHHNLLKYKKG